MGTRKHINETKIKLVGKHLPKHGVHIANLEKPQVDMLDQYVNSRSQWIRDECMTDFNLELNTMNDIANFNIALKSELYKDKADWVREKIRYLKKARNI